MIALKKLLAILALVSFLSSCGKEKIKVLSDYCSLQPDLPIASEMVESYWQKIEFSIVSKESAGVQLLPDESFAKYFIEYAAKSEKIKELKCLDSVNLQPQN